MSLKRKLLISAAAALPLLLLSVVFLLSTPMIEVYQRRIDRDPDSDSSRWLQMISADACFRTWRYELAATGYRRFYERYTRDERRAAALLRYAQSLEEAERNADAKDIYEKYIAEYPELEGKADAELGIKRIAHCKK
jgi:tetratricopeptide (TPR) repeat protein